MQAARSRPILSALSPLRVGALDAAVRLGRRHASRLDGKP
jgi:hypothetical protein